MKFCTGYRDSQKNAGISRKKFDIFPKITENLLKKFHIKIYSIKLRRSSGVYILVRKWYLSEGPRFPKMIFFRPLATRCFFDSFRFLFALNLPFSAFFILVLSNFFFFPLCSFFLKFFLLFSSSFHLFPL
jgi:hypothetical protein